MVRISSPPQSRSKAVVCASTPRMYPRSGFFLLRNNYRNAKNPKKPSKEPKECLKGQNIISEKGKQDGGQNRILEAAPSKLDDLKILARTLYYNNCLRREVEKFSLKIAPTIFSLVQGLQNHS